MALTVFLLTGCATEPVDAQPATAPSPIIETIAPVGDAHAASTPLAPDEALADLAAEALSEGPVRLAALDDPRIAAGALLTPEQLADSASTFAQFTGLAGLTASQPELREGSPDFLARAIVFVDTQGEPAGMVVAISETRQIYIWVNEAGEAVSQYTDQSQPLEGEQRAAAIAQHWSAYLALLQEQVAAAEQGAEQAEVEQSPNAIVAFQVVSLDEARENNGFLKHNAGQSRLFVNPAMLSEAQADSLDSMVAELQLADDRLVSAILSIAAQESLAQVSDPNQLEWVQALKALLEQKTFLKNAVVVVDQTDTGYRLWFTDRTIPGAQKFFNSYYDTAIGAIVAFKYTDDLRPMVAERVMNDPNTGRPGWIDFARIEWSVQTQSMIVRNDFSKLWEYTADGWRSHVLPHERTAEDELYTFEQITGLVGEKVCKEIGCPVSFSLLKQQEEVINGVRTINFVVPAQDAQGNPIEASKQVVVFTASVNADGNPDLPLILRYNFKTAGHEYRPIPDQFAKVEATELDLMEEVTPGFRENMLWRKANIGVIASHTDLSDMHAASHSPPSKVRGYNFLQLNPDNLPNDVREQVLLAWSLVILEWMEMLGDVCS